MKRFIGAMETLTSEVKAVLAQSFDKCIRGYHLVNEEPMKEAPWEAINATILGASGLPVQSQARGSHKSGADIQCEKLGGGLSNKSAQYQSHRKSFKVSSYRLTGVCSDKCPGKSEDILAEIEKRKNFGYYSILVREEETDKISYDWYLFPADLPELNPRSYEWGLKTGKLKKNKGAVMGWETGKLNGSSMSITFAMSSQLWMEVYLTENMEGFRIGSCTVEKKKPMTYIELFDKLGLGRGLGGGSDSL